MLKQLLANFLDSDVYIQVWEERLKVLAITSDDQFDQPPFIAIAIDSKGKSVVKAVGSEAKLFVRAQGIEVTNPFSHPRQLIANFQKAEKILQYAFRQVFANKLFTPSPRAIIQPMERLEGGLTEVETRAFRELCLGAWVPGCRGKGRGSLHWRCIAKARLQF